MIETTALQLRSTADPEDQSVRPSDDGMIRFIDR